MWIFWLSFSGFSGSYSSYHSFPFRISAHLVHEILRNPDQKDSNRIEFHFLHIHAFNDFAYLHSFTLIHYVTHSLLIMSLSSSQTSAPPARAFEGSSLSGGYCYIHAKLHHAFRFDFRINR
ncbi:hypothetical protein GGU11DRAFT_560286 [Lentinula aff. detonsa]|nr:hypothetical protein GGU11DRAFT_560286 [Lentinula aff. detonsa]